jgi:hypothetical protein
VIELKRARNKLQLLQATAYAAMVSTLSRDEIRNLVGIDKGHLDDLPEFEGDAGFNDSQGVLLIAEESTLRFWLRLSGYTSRKSQSSASEWQSRQTIRARNT